VAQHGSPDRSSFDALVARSYQGLKRLAAITMRENRDGASLATGPTSILNEALGRLAAQEARPQGEEHLRGLATMTLRRVLSDRRRRRDAEKRGGGRASAPLTEASAQLFESVGHAASRDESVARVRAALAALLECEPRRGEALVLSASSGLPVAQIAEVLGVSVPTVERDLRFARAWIAAWLEDRDASSEFGRGMGDGRADP
jgi:RNA polymerase sigma factor (TIGR02999 family)